MANIRLSRVHSYITVSGQDDQNPNVTSFMHHTPKIPSQTHLVHDQSAEQNCSDNFQRDFKDAIVPPLSCLEDIFGNISKFSCLGQGMTCIILCSVENLTYNETDVFTNERQLRLPTQTFGPNICNNTHTKLLVHIFNLFNTSLTNESICNCSNTNSCFINQSTKENPGLKQTVEPPAVIIFKYICGVLSITSLTVLIGLHAIYRKLLTTHGKCMVCLALSLLLSNITLVLLLHTTGIICIVAGVACQFSWLAVFFWAAIMAFDIARRFCTCTKSSLVIDGHIGFHRYIIVGFGIPCLISVVCVVMEFGTGVHVGFGSRQAFGAHCWLENDTVLYASFYLPFVCCQLFSWICFICTIIGIQRSSQHPVSHVRNRCFIYLRISLIIGVTWILSFVNGLLNWEFLNWICIGFNGLQGAFLLLNYVLSTRFCQVIKESRRKCQSPHEVL